MTKLPPLNRILLPLLVVLGVAMAPLSTAVASPGDEKSSSKHSRVEGRVLGSDARHSDAKPLASAKVYAYEVASYAMVKVLTDRRGHFSFRSLPAGMYQIVAYKDGFAPTIELLLRKDPDSPQFVELQMQDEMTANARQAEGYWSVRGRLPADVLRDIGSQHLIPESMIIPGMQLDQTSVFSAEMMADGGVEQLGGGLGDAQITTTQVAVEGTVGSLKVGLEGRLQQLAQVSATQTELGALADGEVHSLQLKVEHDDKSTLRVSAGGGQLNGLEAAQVEPAHVEHYGVDWRGNAGSNGESRVTARYAEESNLHNSGQLAPSEIPGASRTFDVTGKYNAQITPQTSLEAGLTYRQQVGEDNPSTFDKGSGLIDGALSLLDEHIRDESFGVFTTAESQIQPKVLIEYGLFSSVRDGSLSLTPHGGLVVQLGEDWKAHTSFSHRIEEDRNPNIYEGFRSSFFGDRSNCQQAGEACYEVMFSQSQEATGDSISIGAVHRKFAETLRLYFSPDFFNRLESVFVVEGDSLPEVQFSMVRQVSPKVLARLQSNIAAGGGGIFYATDEQAYENQVRYLVTSLDTRFQNTATGIFIAFHHLEQSFNPVDSAQKNAAAAPEVEMQRLQLMLTQDLNILVDVASKWAVRLNVELSRGSTPYTLTPSDDLRKKLTGGISVSF